MIIPSIDLADGQAVQLIGGTGPALASADPMEKMRQFSLVGEVAVIDLDAARGTGNNSELIERLCSMGRVRVGGGIRDADTALRWLDAGAQKVILGTAASESLLANLPRERVIVALDSRDGVVLSHGWARETGTSLDEAILRFRGLCAEFLITFVEMEGRMGGTDLDRAEQIVGLAGHTRVTVAGGITESSEIASLDAIGADAQVGMALYTGRLGLAEALTAPLSSERPDGLWPTVVTDRHGVALGLTWSSLESVSKALETSSGVYQSRTRGLWVKGESSGAYQSLLSIDLDCDRDALKFTVDQEGPGFCHLDQHTCWGEDRGISRLSRRIATIARERPGDSNTTLLLDDPRLLAAKLVEEAGELAESDRGDLSAEEAADVIYFTLVKAVASGATLSDIESVLDRRELAVVRRPMVAKEDL